MSQSAEFFFIGGMREDYCITADGRPISGVLGGNAVYSAVGAHIWVQRIGIVSRVGKNFPQGWIENLETHGILTNHIKTLDEDHPSVTFYAYLTPEERVDTNPIAHYARIGIAMPRALFNYKNSTPGQDSRTEYFPLTVRPRDLGDLQHKLKGAHLAPAEFLAHNTLPYALRQAGVEIITVDPSVRYMSPEFRDEVPKIIHGLDAFLPSEMEALSYFAPAQPEVWEMAEAFTSMGCRFVIIKQGARGQVLYDGDSGNRWRIPAYPATVRDVTGAGDSFCGGFIAGLAQTNDPLEAALRANVSASLTVEGTGALYALDTAPGLAESRLNAMRSRVRQI